MLYGYNYTELAKDLMATGADIIGLEEVFDKAERNFYQDTMKLLGEDNVRETTLFPRDLSRLEP